MPVTVHRKAALPPVARNACRVGAAQVDLTPHVGLPLAGYSVEGKRSNGVRGRLFARALFMEDSAGHRAAIVYIDWHSASRYLLEQVAFFTADFGVSVDRLLLVGTHAHTGPGQYYGNSLYDVFSQVEPGFDDVFGGWVAERIAQAVRKAAHDAVPGRLGFASATVWGVSRNRSLNGFSRNPEAAHWNQSGYPGYGAPAWLDRTQRSIDPRVQVLAAVTDDGALLAAFATFACHGTALGPRFDGYSPDWHGWAARAARRRLRGAAGVPIVALGNGAAGDVTPLPLSLEQGPEVASRVGGRVGDAIADAAMVATADATTFTIDVRYGESRISDRKVDGRADTELADAWCFGAPTIGGSEESRSGLFNVGLVHEGMTNNHFQSADPQHPKAPAFGLFQQHVANLLNLDPCPVLPLHLLRIGTHLFATVPGEATLTTAHRIERSLRASTGAQTVTLLGYAGDYGGYYTTEEEFRAQQYEGASTLLGRNASRHLQARLEKLATQAAPAPIAASNIVFNGGPQVQRFHPEANTITHAHATVPAVTRNGPRLEIRWRMRADVRVRFAEVGWFARLEQDAGGGQWTPVRVDGEDFDDVHHDLVVRSVRHDALGPDDAGWLVMLWLPKLPRPRLPLRVVVRAVAPFAGFAVAVPAG